MKGFSLRILCSFLVFLTVNCIKHGDEEARDYREDMRTFVQEISSYTRSYNGTFIIVPQNGQELLTENGEEDGAVTSAYMAAIDGSGREDLFYGYNDDNVSTPVPERDYMIVFLAIAEDAHIEALVTDYCWTPSHVDDSYAQNETRGYISFAAHHRELDTIPSYPENPHNENSIDISGLADARNFLYLIDPGLYSDKNGFISALTMTNFDLLIIDLFFADEVLSPQDVSSLKVKNNGASRLVIAYMSIGEAEDYRYYWDTEWQTSPPEWLEEQNPNWPGNYKVRYWHSEWQRIIFGNDSSYCKRIIDAFEYFESQ